MSDLIEQTAHMTHSIFLKSHKGKDKKTQTKLPINLFLHYSWRPYIVTYNLWTLSYFFLTAVYSNYMQLQWFWYFIAFNHFIIQTTYKMKWCHFLVLKGLKFGFKRMTLLCQWYIKNPTSNMMALWNNMDKTEPWKEDTLSVTRVWQSKTHFKMRK